MTASESDYCARTQVALVLSTSAFPVTRRHHKCEKHPRPLISPPHHHLHAKLQRSRHSWGDRSQGVYSNSPNWDHIAEENPLSESWTLADSAAAQAPHHTPIPLQPSLPFFLPFTPPTLSPTPRWLGCQELRCMGLYRKPPPRQHFSLLPAKIRHSALSRLLSLPPPIPLLSNTSPSASQWSRSCQKLQPRATLCFALFFSLWF